MSVPLLQLLPQLLEFSRERTLTTLAAIEQLPDSDHVLGWRPGPGRAHLAWQLMHIGITEELFATDRFRGTPPSFPDLVPRFRGGSTPDDDIPAAATIREVLAKSRQSLLVTLASLTEAELPTIPPALQARGLTIAQALRIIPWHEAHHQGQAHITLNLYKAQHAQQDNWLGQWATLKPAYRVPRIEHDKGDHSIPPADIRRRYSAGLRNMFQLYLPIFDAWRLFDGSTSPPSVIAFQESGQFQIKMNELYRAIERQLGNLS